MKVILTFKLPEQDDLFQRTINGPGYCAALDELIAMLRSKTKHGHNYESTEQALSELYDYVISLKNEAESSE